MADRLEVVPRVLVVEDDASIQAVVRLGLELEGFEVVVAGTLAEAGDALEPGIDGVVLDRQLPDGDGLQLLARLAAFDPPVRVVVHSTTDDGQAPVGIPRAPKGDVDAILAALALTTAAPVLGASALLRGRADDLVAQWRLLCQWDPMLPPDDAPEVAIGCALVTAIAEAVGRPQPLGWGADPAVETVVGRFVESRPALDVAIAELACLREALRRGIEDRVPPGEEHETRLRLHTIVDRAMVVAVQHALASAP